MKKECTVKDFQNKFNSDDVCLEWLKNKFYPDGIFCKKCSKITKHYKAIDRPSYCCEFCGNHVHPTANTIFHKSTTPLKDWFYAIYLMSSTRCGISAKQLQRELGVTYKTAWRMFHHIRLMLKQDFFKGNGTFEINETYVGGKHHGKTGRGSENKTVVFGLAERNGRITAKRVKDVKAKTLIPIICNRVASGSKIYTDELASYSKLKKLNYKHEVVNHSTNQFANGDIHVNILEGFWSLFKRGLNGVYHSAGKQHLNNYLNEYVFRYNYRDSGEPMFYLMMDRIDKGYYHL